MPSNNPRYRHYKERQNARAWVLATQDHCHLCGLPVDKTLPKNSPMAPEVDEVVPISRGGSPIDKDNLRLAHRICNQRRGNKMITTKTINQPLPQPTDW